MKHLHDELIKNLFIKIIILSLLCMIFFYYVRNPFIFVFYCLVILIVIYRYLNKRSKDIQELLHYLKRLNQNDFSYNLNAYDEGELSLLYSEVNKTTVSLKTSNDLLIKNKKFLNQSLEDISHQLKTPITALSLLNELQEDDELVNKSRDQIDRLEWLVVSLLKLTQLEVDVIDMKQELVKSRDLVEKSISMIMPLMGDKDIEIIVSIEDEDLLCNFNWTQEAIVNILNNKIRFAKSKISISVLNKRLFTEIRIGDDGAAIKEKREIFERFYRSDSEGVGIGLSLSKAIIEYQKGKIFVEEENTFVIILYK